MVILRLRRGGRKHSPDYRIVAQEKRSKLNGAYIESVGHYHPAGKDKVLVIDKDKVKVWLERGAELSTTVNNLLVKEGVLPKKEKISRVYSKKKQSEEEKPDQPKAEAKAEAKETGEAPTEAPAEEVKEEAPTEEKNEEPKEEPKEDSKE